MPITTLVANTPALASDMNDNFTLCVLTDTTRTITVAHTFSVGLLITQAQKLSLNVDADTFWREDSDSSLVLHRQGSLTATFNSTGVELPGALQITNALTLKKNTSNSVAFQDGSAGERAKILATFGSGAAGTLDLYADNASAVATRVMRLTGTPALTIDGATTISTGGAAITGNSSVTGTLAVSGQVDIGDSLSFSGAPEALVVGNTDGNAEIMIGQSSTRGLEIYWLYNATAGNATALIQTFSGANQLQLMRDGAGALVLGGASSNVGFFNGAGTTKQTVTGSRGGNAALASLLTALAAYGLLTDSSS